VDTIGLIALLALWLFFQFYLGPRLGVPT